jgi:uncharacterized repeat protein (TIGR01451 family)
LSLHTKPLALILGTTIVVLFVVLVGLGQTAAGAHLAAPYPGRWSLRDPSSTAMRQAARGPGDERLLLAFYYPWYRFDNWSSPEMLDDPLFPYASDDTSVIALQVNWAQQAGLDGFVISWWGSDYSFLDDNTGLVLDAMLGTPLRAAIYFETFSTNFATQAQIVSEMEYAIDTHGAHPNYLKHDGRPVIFIYGTWAVPLEGSPGSYQAWQSIVGRLRADGYSPVLIGDALDARFYDVFDGLHTYLALQTAAYYQDFACQAQLGAKLWVGNAYPGYDDRLLGRITSRYIPRDGGQTYAETFDDALLGDPQWIVITSFNEWWENTHIEPGVIYEADYLSHTLELSQRYDAWRATPVVHVDAAYSGPEDGSATGPFNSLAEALHVASYGATVKVASGTYTGTLVLSRSVTLEGGYEHGTWERDLSAHRTTLKGDGSGPVVVIKPDYCTAPDVTLQGLTITGGDVKGAGGSGGGIHVQDGSVLLANDVISGNVAEEKGGGVYFGGNGQLTVEASRIISNVATTGGGLFIGGPTQLVMTNALVARNKARIAGGGLYHGVDVETQILNSTFVDNVAPDIGAGIQIWPVTTQSANFINTILWGNGADGAGDPRNNLECPQNCSVTYGDVGGGWPGSGNLDSDPSFQDRAGGDYHLRFDSPAVDAGDPAGAQPAGPAPLTDLEGDTRPLGAGVDLGMDEVNALGASSFTVDAAVAAPGERLAYSLLITTSATTATLSAQATAVLPPSLEYVPDTLQSSSGQVTYLPPDGTLQTSRLTWAGDVVPGEGVQVTFEATISGGSAVECADASVIAIISGAGAPVQRRATTLISSQERVRIQIQDAADSSGQRLQEQTLRIGESLTAYAGAYDMCGLYLGLASATWETSGTLPYQQGTGESFEFVPTVAGGTGTITADDGQGHTAQSGLIVVEPALADLSFSTPRLSSSQLTDRRVTETFTISNNSDVTLTYQVLTTPHPFELTFRWDDSMAIAKEPGVWDLFFSPEQVAAELAGGEVVVQEVEVRTSGVNIAEWINWDFEIHLSGQPISLPPGQKDDSPIDPWTGYARNAPTQLLLAIGERQLSGSYVYSMSHDFVTDQTTVTPFYGRVKDSFSAPLELSDGLHAQLAFWTGDRRIRMQFIGAELIVRGTVTYRLPDWLTLPRTSGQVATQGQSAIDAVFDSTLLSPDLYPATIAFESNARESLSKLPVQLRVFTMSRIYLPLVVKYE